MPGGSQGAAAATSAQRKLKVLALHGYLQNADVFRSRTGALRKALKKHCEFVFVNAPHHIQVDLQGNDIVSCDGDDHAKCYGWWLAGPEGGPPREAKSAKGWETSLGVLEETLRREGPFDGLLGFSMGAAASALLCAAIESKRVSCCHDQFKFALLFGGFVPRDPVLAESLRDAKLSIPSIHYSGLADELVVADRSRELVGCFSEGVATFESHPQGHCIPSLREVREKCKAFVADRTNP